MGCSRRTVWRDLAVLQAVGFPLTTEPDGRENRYRLIEGTHGLPPIPFTLTELASLHLGRHLLVPLRGTPLGEPIHSALEKIAAILAPRAKAFLDTLHQELSARTLQAKDYRGSTEILRTVQDAIRDRRTLEVEYHSYGRDVVTRRRLDPLHLWVQQGGIYLAAYCHQRLEVRTFALERIRHARATSATFKAHAGFDLDHYLEGSFGVFRGRPVRVVLRFSREVARFITERRWYPTQVLSPLLTGEVDLALRAPVCPELKRWILGYGKDVEVLKPGGLREEIRREWLAALRGPRGQVKAARPARKGGTRVYRPPEPRPLLTAVEAPTDRGGRRPARGLSRR